LRCTHLRGETNKITKISDIVPMCNALNANSGAIIRRQRRDAARIPLRVWLAVLDQGIEPMREGGDLRRTLPRLTAPALLLWGSKDPLIEEEGRQTLREALPQAQVKVFDGLGHNPFWEDPRACAEVINAFLTAAPEADRS